jgi:PAS domain S-box-containing protein
MASRTTDTAPTVEDQLRRRIRELEAQIECDREIQQALTASEERFDLAVRGSNDGIWDWDIRTDEVYYSPRFKELLGYSIREMSNRFEEFESRLHPEDLKATIDALKAHIEHDVPYDVEYRLRCKNGAYRWFRARGRALRATGGRAYRMAGSISDVTERREAVRALAESEERFKLAVLGTNDGIWDWDVRTGAVYFSPRWKTMIGYETSELADNFTTFVEHVHPDDKDRVLQHVKDYLERRLDHYSVEFRFRHKDGSYRWILARGIALWDDTGKAYRMSGSHTDITAHKEAITALARSEEQLMEAKRAAEMANLAKSEFLANMSHEIRTPMNGILGLTELLLNMQLSPEQRTYEGLVRQSAESLLTILNDILDFSKIEAGRLDLDEHEFRLRDALGDTLQSLGVRAAEKNLEIACQIDPKVPDLLIGDLSRLRQIMTNLVGNAIKFTHQGEVVVSVTQERADRQHALLHFSVRDTGIGIPRDKHDAVFEAFTQAESSTTRRYGGTGLGLTICRQLVHLMGGTIWVESIPAEGSTFHFTAKFGLAARTRKSALRIPRSLRGLQVLVVDDNATNRKILEEMLRQWHMEPVLAASGKEGLALLEGWKDRPFKLILLDVMMPEMDGPEFARRVRQRYGDDSPKIIVLSSAGHLMHLTDTTQSGVARVITKPVKQSELLAAIQKAFRFPGYNTTMEEEDRRIRLPVRPLRLLLAEDGRVNQLVATKLLQDRGHVVSLASNGREVLELLEDQEFDAILMDIQMPIMNGFEATAIIRERERDTIYHVPIIAMTANAMQGDRERCLAAGMDDYVSKPVRSAELFRAVEECAADAGGPPAPDPPPATEPQQGLVFDEAHFRRSIGDQALMSQLIAIFPEDSEAFLRQADAAIAARDVSALYAAAHSLKGMIGNYSAPRAGEAIRSTCELAHDGRLEEAIAACHHAHSEVRRLALELQKFKPAP